MILIELKDLTIQYTKKEAKTRKEAFKGLTKDLNEAESENDSTNVKIFRDKIKQLEEMFIEEECAKRKTYTILEDEHPSKTFLNIESRKQGYNEIDKLVIKNPKNKTKKEPDTYETTDY